MLLAFVVILGASPLAEAAARVRTPAVIAKASDGVNGTVKVEGCAASHEAVADHLPAHVTTADA
ncbi:MAG: hypothetical protein JNK82_27850 [Myxococcaceae bacterium]|nr:hypothetical protein [Myxococcaceae bacterium]